MKIRLIVATALACGWAALGADLRIGIIGCDTSHVVAFTETLNDPQAKGHIPGGKIVAAYKGGSADIPSSFRHIEGYSKTLREKYGVKFYDRIEEMCKDVDAVMLESVDGRPHLAQVKPVLQAHKPVFIDKPMAASLADVLEIFRLAKEAKVPVFSSSSLRFAKDTQAVHNGSIGKVTYAETYGPCELDPHHPDLFWYGVHGVESLFTIMGTGCQTVQRQTTAAGAPKKSGGSAVLDALKGTFRASIYGARVASQDSAKSWIAKAFDTTPDYDTAIQYDENVRAKLDKINPNSIPNFLRDQDISAAEAKTLQASKVSAPQVDKDAQSETKSYQPQTGGSSLGGGMVNSMFSGLDSDSGSSVNQEIWKCTRHYRRLF